MCLEIPQKVYRIICKKQLWLCFTTNRLILARNLLDKIKIKNLNTILAQLVKLRKK